MRTCPLIVLAHASALGPTAVLSATRSRYGRCPGNGLSDQEASLSPQPRASIATGISWIFAPLGVDASSCALIQATIGASVQAMSLANAYTGFDPGSCFVLALLTFLAMTLDM